MSFRHIDDTQAAAVLTILKEECGYRVDDRDAESFIRSIRATPAMKRNEVCTEYRFCGALGFGGKFRNNGNYDNTPYVDYYQENKTPAREKMVARANLRLKQLFHPLPSEGL